MQLSKASFRNSAYAFVLTVLSLTVIFLTLAFSESWQFIISKRDRYLKLPADNLRPIAFVEMKFDLQLNNLWIRFRFIHISRNKEILNNAENKNNYSHEWAGCTTHYINGWFQKKNYSNLIYNSLITTAMRSTSSLSLFLIVSLLFSAYGLPLENESDQLLKDSSDRVQRAIAERESIFEGQGIIY